MKSLKYLLLICVLGCSSVQADTFVKADGNGGEYCKDKWGQEYHNISANNCENLGLVPKQDEDFKNMKVVREKKKEKSLLGVFGL